MYFVLSLSYIPLSFDGFNINIKPGSKSGKIFIFLPVPIGRILAVTGLNIHYLMVTFFLMTSLPRSGALSLSLSQLVVVFHIDRREPLILSASH